MTLVAFSPEVVVSLETGSFFRIVEGAGQPGTKIRNVWWDGRDDRLYVQTDDGIGDRRDIIIERVLEPSPESHAVGVLTNQEVAELVKLFARFMATATVGRPEYLFCLEGIKTELEFRGQVQR